MDKSETSHNTLPDIGEVRAAMRTIERAEKAITEKMVKAGLPNGRCRFISMSHYASGVVMVDMTSSEKLWGLDGKLNCNDGQTSYAKIDEAIKEATANWERKRRARAKAR